MLRGSPRGFLFYVSTYQGEPGSTLTCLTLTCLDLCCAAAQSYEFNLHSQFATDDAIGALQAFNRRTAIVGIEQTVHDPPRSACLHEFRDAL